MGIFLTQIIYLKLTLKWVDKTNWMSTQGWVLIACVHTSLQIVVIFTLCLQKIHPCKTFIFHTHYQNYGLFICHRHRDLWLWLAQVPRTVLQILCPSTYLGYGRARMPPTRGPFDKHFIPWGTSLCEPYVCYHLSKQVQDSQRILLFTQRLHFHVKMH